MDPMVPEAPLEQVDEGLAPAGEGWFVLNARDADQEDFLVVHGEALLIAEGEERPLRQWDFVHCPAGMNHVIVGAGDGPCVVVAVGARQHQDGPDWGGYPVDDAARRHNAGVDVETTIPEEAYARFTPRQPARYRDDWLP